MEWGKPNVNEWVKKSKIHRKIATARIFVSNSTAVSRWRTLKNSTQYSFYIAERIFSSLFYFNRTTQPNHLDENDFKRLLHVAGELSWERMHIFEDPTAPTRHNRKLFPAVRGIPQQVFIQQVEYHRRPHSSSNRVHESTWEEKKYEDRKKRKRNIFLEAHVYSWHPRRI